MNAPADPAAFAAPAPRTPRHDGWTPERQRAFLEAVADGYTADAAARGVGLSATSAYALRRRPAGAAFALGWDAARLLAREAVADALSARAADGQEERITRPDGSEVVRFRYDNRLAQYLLTRLDRYADGQAPTDAGRAARLAAQDFDQYLGLVAAGAGPARAALFLRAREPEPAAGQGAAARPARAPAPAPGLPLAALARADLCLRAGAGLPHEVDASDLDPDGRAGWTADQWARAEAAGLLVLAPAAPAHEPQLPQLSDADDPGPPVWWDGELRAWRTRFPPPPDTFVDEDGAWGDDGYERDLSFDERDVLDAAADAGDEADREGAEAERAAWFAAAAAECGYEGGAADAAGQERAGQGRDGPDPDARDGEWPDGDGQDDDWSDDDGPDEQDCSAPPAPDAERAGPAAPPGDRPAGAAPASAQGSGRAGDAPDRGGGGGSPVGHGPPDPDPAPAPLLPWRAGAPPRPWWRPGPGAVPL